MVDASKLTLYGQPTDEELKRAEAAQTTAWIEHEEKQAQPQSEPSPAFVQAVRQSPTEIRLAEIDRKLNAILDHLNIPR